MQTPFDELVELVAGRPNDAFLLIGSGVSIATTRNAPTASWRGLLEHGISYCVAQVGATSSWESIRHHQLNELEYIQVATEIAAKLGAPRSGRYAEWLEETIGSLTRAEQDTRLIDAIARWNVNISTTNYDHLIEARTGFTPITWRDKARLGQFTRAPLRDVLHIHGDFRHPDSVVFDAQTYNEVTESRPIQAVLRSLCLVRSPIFIGCGFSGLDDPNIGSLIQWCKDTLEELAWRGYLIAAESDIAHWRTRLGSSQIRLVSFGKSHADLPAFLERIADEASRRRSSLKPLEDLVSKQRGFDTEIKAIKSRLGSAGPVETLRELMKIARSHWQAGGKRSAWISVSSRLSQEGAQLQAVERLEFVLEVAQMQLSDGAEEQAFSTLREVEDQVSSEELPAQIRGKYWDLTARCLGAMGFYSNAREILDRAVDAATSPEARARLMAERAEILYLQFDESVPSAVDVSGIGVTSIVAGDLLLESTTPGVRSELVDLRLRAMGGQVERALKDLTARIGQLTSASREEDLVSLALLRAEILYHQGRRKESRDQFDQIIQPRLSALSPLARFAVQQNYVDVRSEFGSDEFLDALHEFYHLYDQREITGTKLQNHQEIAHGHDAVSEGDFKEAMSAFWQDSLRTYRQGCWDVHRHAMKRLGRGWLAVGEPIDAALCAIIAKDDKLAKNVAEEILRRRDPEIVRKVVDRLLALANLNDHFSVACILLTTIGDAIPDDQIDRLGRWLLDRISLQENARGSSGPLYRAWQCLAAIAPRVSAELARLAVECATAHQAWLNSQPGKISVARERIVETLQLLVSKLPETAMMDLAQRTLPLAVERRQDHDYGDVLNLLSQISFLGGDEVKSFVGSRLFASGRQVDYLMAQFAPYYDKIILQGQELHDLALRAARNVGLQVQLRPLGQPFDPVVGVIMTGNREVGDTAIQTSLVNLMDWHAIIPHRKRLEPDPLRALTDAAITMLAEPHNELSNRVGLIQGLAKLRDVMDSQTIDAVVRRLEPIARGQIQDPNQRQNHPLDSFKFNTTTPAELRGVAVIGIARIAAGDADRHRAVVEELIEHAMGDASADVRRGGVTGFRDFPCRSDSLLLWVLLATRDPDPIASTSAFAAVGSKTDLILNRNHWRLLLASIQMASLSQHADLRRHAAWTLRRLQDKAPSGSIRTDVTRLLEIFASDECASVRTASKGSD